MKEHIQKDGSMNHDVHPDALIQEEWYTFLKAGKLTSERYAIFMKWKDYILKNTKYFENECAISR